MECRSYPMYVPGEPGSTLRHGEATLLTLPPHEGGDARSALAAARARHQRRLPRAVAAAQVDVLTKEHLVDLVGVEVRVRVGVRVRVRGRAGVGVGVRAGVGVGVGVRVRRQLQRLTVLDAAVDAVLAMDASTPWKALHSYADHATARGGSTWLGLGVRSGLGLGLGVGARVRGWGWG